VNQALAREILLFEQETSLRILIAATAEDLRRLLAVALRRDGHDVIEARDAAELLNALASTLIEPVESPFDVLICEHTLPGIPGLTVLAGLRARQPATPFILVTDRSAVRERAQKLGAAVVDRLDVQGIGTAVRRAAEFLRLLRP
jgi:DNA-binding response OmpR family regulator